MGGVCSDIHVPLNPTQAAFANSGKRKSGVWASIMKLGLKRKGVRVYKKKGGNEPFSKAEALGPKKMLCGSKLHGQLEKGKLGTQARGVRIRRRLTCDSEAVFLRPRLAYTPFVCTVGFKKKKEIVQAKEKRTFRLDSTKLAPASRGHTGIKRAHQCSLTIKKRVGVRKRRKARAGEG